MYENNGVVRQVSLDNHITAVSLPVNLKISHGQVLKIYTFAIMAGPKSVFAHFIVS